MAAGVPVVRVLSGFTYVQGIRDQDEDTVMVEDDQCPKMAEDTDGFGDTDGCPDLDNDDDGIPDTVDECVNEPEDFNKKDDEDGCPDEEKKE